MIPNIGALSDQADASRPSGLSQRLDAVIEQLPKYQRSRMVHGLYREGVRTLADLCATKRAQLEHLPHVGKQSIANLEDTLRMLGLSLAEHPSMNTINTLSDQADASRPLHMSPRLDAVIEQLPKYQRTRMAYGLYNEGIRTLTGLCATKRARLQRLKNVGKRSITNLEDTLAMLGLSLADRPLMTTKAQTPAQRITNPVWLRQQIATLVADCDENITEDLALAAKEHDDAKRARYEASVDCHRHWKRQLERILSGKTSIEDLADTLIEQGAQP